MDERQLARLRESVGTGEIIRIIYDGGSQPGTAREIIPLSIAGEMLWAVSPGKSKRKSFALEKIRFCDGDDVPEMLISDWTSLEDYRAGTAKRFADAGYLLEVLPPDPAPGLALYGYRKDGQRRKHPFARLEYLTTVLDYETTPDSREVEVERPRKKCWVLSVQGKRASYSTLQKAGLALLEQYTG